MENDYGIDVFGLPLEALTMREPIEQRNDLIRKQKVCLIEDLDKLYYLRKGMHLGPKSFDALYDQSIEQLETLLEGEKILARNKAGIY